MNQIPRQTWVQIPDKHGFKSLDKHGFKSLDKHGFKSLLFMGSNPYTNMSCHGISKQKSYIFYMTLTQKMIMIKPKNIYHSYNRQPSLFVFRGKHSPNLSPLCLHYNALPVRLYNCRQCRLREAGRVFPPEDKEGGGCSF